MNSKMITYDQPLSEIIRICLRLEQLFQLIDHQRQDDSQLGTRNVINFMINVLQILERPDLKTKLAKELSDHHTTLMRYSKAPGVDVKKLETSIQQLETLQRDLINSSGKIGQRLRDVELLNNLRLHTASIGGGCSFDTPLYHYWLHQPAATREGDLTDWLGDFTPIRTAITLTLDIVRQNAVMEEKTAIHGFHQELLDPQSKLRMIRIGVDSSIHTYPEISVGRHFLSLRFFSPDILNRPTQYADNLPFSLAYCH